jgi:hypothetical protein
MFNVMRIGEIDVDSSDRPIDPPVILAMNVISNPFPEIVCRKISSTLANIERKKQSQKLSNKNTSLLSFADDNEGYENETEIESKRPRFERTRIMPIPTDISAINLPSNPAVKSATLSCDEFQSSINPVEKMGETSKTKKSVSQLAQIEEMDVSISQNQKLEKLGSKSELYSILRAQVIKTKSDIKGDINASVTGVNAPIVSGRKEYKTRKERGDMCSQGLFRLNKFKQLISICFR